ncbi:tni-3 [Pristionchus pacificus]|uniref:Tni-3 n=1 Tax=Pristionchus pacificus TaxID=54126 RepID=A0A2A6D1D6_PRIPA|nr:tni-3 [Pristionchus pacificus]|eukprot:PDM84103.1 tni-3 [Pristionchus pacificus]
MADEMSDAQRKKEEMERRKAEVRKRLEESGKAGKKAKKGFLTPERKKKLRKLLMFKAAEELKSQQLLKEQERQKILAQRTIPCPEVDDINDQGKLLKIYEELFDVVRRLEDEKFDINQLVLVKETEINTLTIAVNDLRGKYVKPTLKKVSKYDNKFKQATKTEGEAPKKADFRNNLKVVKKETNIDELLKKKEDKPDWKAEMKGEKVEKKEEEKEEKAEEPEPVAEEAPAAAEEAEEEGGKTHN